MTNIVLQLVADKYLENEMSRSDWLKNWLKPSNLIALGALIVAVIGVWGGITIFSNKQELKVKNKCDVSQVKQIVGNKASSSQTIECSEDSKIEGVVQE